jgi:hypothetical protein
MDVNSESAALLNGDRIGGKLGRRQWNRGVLRSRTAPVQARLDADCQPRPSLITTANRRSLPLLWVAVKRLDLGTCEAIRHDGDPERCVVLLPGQFYPTRGPVLWFARESAMARGWSALEALGEPGLRANPLAWERHAAEGALAAAAAEQVVVIGKSLASLLADLANARGLPAVWLTPVLSEPAVPEALAQARRPALLIGGTADPLWNARAIPHNPALEVVELEDLDHSLQSAGDPAASLRALQSVVDSTARFLARLELDEAPAI